MQDKRARDPATPVPIGTEATPYRRLLRRTLIRLFLMYFVPLVIITIFFHIQYYRLAKESQRVHLSAIAENRASTLDLFLRERWINLANIVDDPELSLTPHENLLKRSLASLQSTSETFVDLGLLDEEGNLLAYVGPHTYLQSQNYSGETWFQMLAEGSGHYIITDIYLGFRDEPHFTIAVMRDLEGHRRIVRAALSPSKLYQSISEPEDPHGSVMALVNTEGIFQLVPPALGEPLKLSPFRPPREPNAGILQAAGGAAATYAYAWLEAAPWVLVVTGEARDTTGGVVGPLYGAMFGFSAAILLLGLVALVVRARTVVRFRWEAAQTEAKLSGQLVQAAKMASVGELAAGIAHEINNPLAIIAEGAGLMKDMMDPNLGGKVDLKELSAPLDTIHTAVFRCRDITRKLLSFVRKTDVELRHHDIREIIDEAADGLLGRELSVSNIALVKQYDPAAPPILTDRNQLVQVFVNLLRNAIDAMGGQGRITLKTAEHEGILTVSVSDSGIGMTKEQLEKIFTPFYTTKQPGKGTGLGLSVSYSIVKNLGGEIYVDSVPGQGSRFQIKLPYQLKET